MIEQILKMWFMGQIEEVKAECEKLSKVDLMQLSFVGPDEMWPMIDEIGTRKEAAGDWFVNVWDQLSA